MFLIYSDIFSSFSSDKMLVASRVRLSMSFDAFHIVLSSFRVIRFPTGDEGKCLTFVVPMGLSSAVSGYYYISYTHADSISALQGVIVGFHLTCQIHRTNKRDSGGDAAISAAGVDLVTQTQSGVAGDGSAPSAAAPIASGCLCCAGAPYLDSSLTQLDWIGRVCLFVLGCSRFEDPRARLNHTRSSTGVDPLIPGS